MLAPAPLADLGELAASEAEQVVAEGATEALPVEPSAPQLPEADWGAQVTINPHSMGAEAEAMEEVEPSFSTSLPAEDSMAAMLSEPADLPADESGGAWEVRCRL